jgi:hypothetical protein
VLLDVAHPFLAIVLLLPEFHPAFNRSGCVDYVKEKGKKKENPPPNPLPSRKEEKRKERKKEKRKLQPPLKRQAACFLLRLERCHGSSHSLQPRRRQDSLSEPPEAMSVSYVMHLIPAHESHHCTSAPGIIVAKTPPVFATIFLVCRR